MTLKKDKATIKKFKYQDIGYKPLKTRLVIRPIFDKDTVTPGGIIIPSSSQDKIGGGRGIVCAVGSDVNPEIKVGMVVHYTNLNSPFITVNGRQHWDIDQYNVFGIFEEFELADEEMEEVPATPKSTGLNLVN